MGKFTAAFLVSFYMFSLKAQANPIVAYITDLEGSRTRFEQFMRQSAAFELGPDGKYHLRKNAHFVFGGDAPDRYLGSRWVVSELVRLKQESPNRVALILGNRDINKMRLTSELSPAALRQPAIKLHFTKEEEWKKHLYPESRAERLKYIFANTMGSPNAFELRGRELYKDPKMPYSSTMNDEIAESFLRDLGPGGVFRRFLELGQLAHRIENTLFLHGGITEENFGAVLSGQIESTSNWIISLNQWLQTGVETWEQKGGPQWNGIDPRPEQPWFDYILSKPGRNGNPESVVAGRSNDHLNNPRLPSKAIIEKLLSEGIERIVVGHSPTGDFAVVLRSTDDRFELVSADNSYATNENFATIVHFKGDKLRQTDIRGTIKLDSGVEVSARSELTLGESTLIGKRLHGTILIARDANEPQNLIRFRIGEKFRTFTNLVSEPEIDRKALDVPYSDCEMALLSSK
jgi:hypothetical protein